MSVRKTACSLPPRVTQLPVLRQVIDKVVKYRGQYEHFALPPQRNASGPVRVMFSLGLIRIVNFDEVNMILTFVALERYVSIIN